MPARLKGALDPLRKRQTAGRMVDHGFRDIACGQFHLPDPPCKFEIFSSRFKELFVKPSQPFEEITTDRQIAAPEQVPGKILHNLLQRMIRPAQIDGSSFY